MVRRLYAILQLILEAHSARRDARTRFMRLQIAILRSKLGGNRVIPSPEDRARLLALGADFNHDVEGTLGIVTRQTYRRWLREQAHGKRPRCVGRPSKPGEWRELAVRLAKENFGWGCRPIVGELRKLRVRLSRSTIQRVLKEEGIVPPPNGRRGLAVETPWQKFVSLHLQTLVACDFFTKEIVTPFGTRTAYWLFFIHVGTRRVFLGPATYYPNERWMMQQARNVLMWLEEQELEAKFLMHDRDTKFTRRFDQFLRDAGLRAIRTPRCAPNANAYAEAWVGSIKRECLEFFMCFSLGHADYIAHAYERFYNECRPHQGVGNRVLSGGGEQAGGGPVRCQRRLGGLLNHYHRQAA